MSPSIFNELSGRRDRLISGSASCFRAAPGALAVPAGAGGSTR